MRRRSAAFSQLHQRQWVHQLGSLSRIRQTVLARQDLLVSIQWICTEIGAKNFSCLSGFCARLPPTTQVSSGQLAARHHFMEDRAGSESAGVGAASTLVGEETGMLCSAKMRGVDCSNEVDRNKSRDKTANSNAIRSNSVCRLVGMWLLFDLCRRDRPSSHHSQ